MDYIFENIGNLDKVNLTITKNKLNIKYGFNGVGKSTIVKAINYLFANDNDKQKLRNELLSFRTGKEVNFPSNLKNEYSNVKIYNSEYFNHLFKQEDLLINTFDLVIDSDKYREYLNPIISNISKLKELIYSAINNNNDLNKTLNKYRDKELIKYKSGDNSSVLKAKSILCEYATKGIKIDVDIPEKLADYKDYIQAGYRTIWYNWICKADDKWYENERCPFCGTAFSSNSLNEKISLLKSFKSKNEFKAYDEEQNFVNEIASFISGEESKQILAFNDLNEKANTINIQPVQNGLNFLKKENEKIQFLLNLDASKYVSAKNKGLYDDLSNNLSINKLNIELALINSSGINVVNDINKLLDEMINELDNLKGFVGKLGAEIKDRIQNNEEFINNFLKISGMPYKVDIKQEGDISFKTLFSFDNSDKPNIDNQLNYLSYGEANALALLLFYLDAKKGKNSLIIFDDPISSFDSNKRYAIYNYIFGKNGDIDILQNHTCLLFTHDFDTVVAFSKCSPFNKKDTTEFDYLALNNHQLIENHFGKKDIINKLDVYKNIAKDNTRPKISRVVAARHIVELISGDCEDEYNILSSLIHLREKPSKGKKESTTFSSEKIKDLDDKMKKYFGYDYSYTNFINELKNDDVLNNLYENSKSKYDKFCLARLLLSKNANNSIETNIVRNFLSEIYHVETDSIHTIGQCGNDDLFDVPEYIIKLCDSLILKFNDKNGN